MRLLDRWRDQALALFRIVTGLLFMVHGAQKLFGAFDGGEPVSILELPIGPASAIEFFGGALVVLGLGTRIVALLCSGYMTITYFVVAQPLGLLPINNTGELAALYSWMFLLLAFAGPGVWALDNMLAVRRPVPSVASSHPTSRQEA